MLDSAPVHSIVLSTGPNSLLICCATSLPFLEVILKVISAPRSFATFNLDSSKSVIENVFNYTLWIYFILVIKVNILKNSHYKRFL